MKPTRSRSWLTRTAFVPLLIGTIAAGCDDGDDKPATTPDAAVPTPDTGTPSPDTSSGSETPPAGETGGCPAEKIVADDIRENTIWDCPVYVLKKKIYVVNDKTLTIVAGTKVIGDAAEADVPALIVTRGAKLDAKGRKELPIVFTASVPKAGSWGGVVLLGKAKINTGLPCAEGAAPCIEAGVEGIAATETKAKFGGLDDEHDCGTLQYARIEFAGKELAPANELNGLTVGACGRATKLSYIQVHKGTDDGVEFFGGTAGIDHLLITDADDDGVDWDLGWSGKAQFIVVHQFPGGLDGHGIEASGAPAKSNAPETAAPRSEPVLYNVTLIGRSDMYDGENRAMHLKEGTRGKMYNFIIQGWKKDIIDFTHKQVDLTMEWPTSLSIENSVFWENVAWPMEIVGMASDDDKGFPDQASVEAPERKNTSVDPGLTSLSETAPNYVPKNADAVKDKATPAFGDTTANYAGAFKPGDPAPWTDGWTAFPAGQ